MNPLHDLVPRSFVAFQAHYPWAVFLFPMLAASCIVSEYLWHRRRGTAGYIKESFTTLLLAAGRLASRGASLILIAPIFLWAYDHRLFHLEVNDPWSLALLFFVVEFFYYWYHRCAHQIRWMWASHSVHHSTTHMNLTAAYRLGWTELFSGDWLFYLMPVLLGFNPFFVIAELTVNLSYQFFLHTDAVKSLGPLEWIFNSPAHHRAHHAMNGSVRDKNFGGILIIFDRMFGTFAAPEAGETLRYGLHDQAPSFNPVRVAFAEWRKIWRDVSSASSLREACRVAFLGKGVA